MEFKNSKKIKKAILKIWRKKIIIVIILKIQYLLNSKKSSTQQKNQNKALKSLQQNPLEIKTLPQLPILIMYLIEFHVTVRQSTYWIFSISNFFVPRSKKKMCKNFVMSAKTIFFSFTIDVLIRCTFYRLFSVHSHIQLIFHTIRSRVRMHSGGIKFLCKQKPASRVRGKKFN